LKIQNLHFYFASDKSTIVAVLPRANIQRLTNQASRIIPFTTQAARTFAWMCSTKPAFASTRISHSRNSNNRFLILGAKQNTVTDLWPTSMMQAVVPGMIWCC